MQGGGGDWSSAWPQPPGASPPLLDTAAEYYHGMGDFAEHQAEGAVRRSGSKRQRTADYAPSSAEPSFVPGQLQPPPSAPADDSSDDFALHMARGLPQSGIVGFYPPRPPQHPPQQMTYQPAAEWPLPSDNSHHGFGQTLSPHYGGPPPYDEGLQGPLPVAGGHGYLSHQDFSQDPLYGRHFFYGVNHSDIGGPSRQGADNYSKSIEWPEGKWAGDNFIPNCGSLAMFQDAADLYGKDASQHLKLQSLTILDNLASQIILSLAKPSLSDLEKLVGDNDSEERQAYMTQKALFDQTRKVYCRDSPFINAYAVQMFTPLQQEIIRKANRATFISSVLEAHDVSFYDLNDSFLEIFVPQGQRLLKWQGTIFLELKTQVFIASLLNNDPNAPALLNDLFPSNMEQGIFARHRDAPHLTPSEQDFLERAKARKQYLQADPNSSAMAALPGKYAWQDFVKEFLNCISKNVDFLLSTPTRSGSAASSNPGSQSLAKSTPVPRPESSQGPPPVSGQESHTERGSKCSKSRGYTNFGALLPGSFEELPEGSQKHKPPGVAASIPASEKSPASTVGETEKKPATTTRQAWRQEEEDALLAGLEEVKGPYWSRILSLYGRGGSRSEVLKDRTQIQLKDKARNIKLWHLKMGNEVPASLQGVTGELRKRGGAKIRAQLGLDNSASGKADKKV